MESLLLSLLLAATSASAVLGGQVVEEPVCVGRPLLLPLGDHVRQRGGAVPESELLGGLLRLLPLPLGAPLPLLLLLGRLLAELFEVGHVSVGDPLPDDAGEALLVLLLDGAEDVVHD